ncbi:MAG: nitroreductase family protein [Treponema sp.]|jgi:nitroreductase|nr:nitroreductase family protein [Treponema sp.]
MSAIFTRRSVRSFLEKPVEPEKMERILRAGMEAPSAHNRRPWEFIVITGEADRMAIAEMSPYAKMVKTAPAVIGVCVDLSLGAPGDEEDAWWVQDLSAATENILLQITEEGLGGVWLGWYPAKERVRAFAERFGFPPQVLPFSLVALGYPAKPVNAADRYDEGRVHYGAYGKKRPG